MPRFMSLMTVALRSMLLLLAVPSAVEALGPSGRVAMRPPPAPTSPGAVRTRLSPRRADQQAAFDQMREGRIRPLREIESNVVPRMSGADYLGPEFDSGSGTYRLKFMRNGSVIWVDVDGRTGAILGRSGE